MPPAALVITNLRAPRHEPPARALPRPARDVLHRNAAGLQRATRACRPSLPKSVARDGPALKATPVRARRQTARDTPPRNGRPTHRDRNRARAQARAAWPWFRRPAARRSGRRSCRTRCLRVEDYESTVSGDQAGEDPLALARAAILARAA